MDDLRQYRRREKTLVTAVQIDLDTDGFTYRKWGKVQVARAGDWLVNSNSNVYTVDRDVFARTYMMRSPGVYEKTGVVWARKAEESGRIETTSGFTEYEAGDMVVFNDKEQTDGWAMSIQEFERLYVAN